MKGLTTATLITIIILSMTACGGDSGGSGGGMTTPSYTVSGDWAATGTITYDSCGFEPGGPGSPGGAVRFTHKSGDNYEFFNGCITQSATRSGNTISIQETITENVQGCTVSVESTGSMIFSSNNKYSWNQKLIGQIVCPGEPTFKCRVDVNGTADRCTGCSVFCTQQTKSINPKDFINQFINR